MTRTVMPQRDSTGPVNQSVFVTKGQRDGEDDEEEVEIRISPTGSVLAPSPNPYDKVQKLRQANAQLMSSRLPPRLPGKVRFNESVIPEETATSSAEGSTNSTSLEPLKSAPSKILLVTVPSGFNEDIEDVPSEEEIIDETDFRHEPIEKTQDVSETSTKFKKTLTFHQDYSVDMKSVDFDDDEDTVIEDLTTTLVSLCRMTSECDDTDLENNISKLKRIAAEETIDEETEDETQNGFEDDDNTEGQVVKTIDDPKKVEEEDDIVEYKSACLIRRASSAQLAPQSPKNYLHTTQNNGEYPERPSTSPAKRVCFKNQWAFAKLPNYNGLRSEYGLSAEQLEERNKKKIETVKSLRQRKEEMCKEERRKQKENELMFASWLVKKKKEAASKAARKKQLPSTFYFKTLPAPTSHLEKMGLLRKKALARREHTCYSLQEFFKNAKPHEQKTYKIYLGVCVE